jgi:2-alkyl-3-oxoalkanoate reductase
MKVFIAGATGVLGRRLVQQFRARGDTVVCQVRSSAGAQLVASLGGESREADLYDVDQLARAADGCEVVIHAVTSIPVKTKTSAKDWEMNDRIRRDGTRALANCVAMIGARLYIQQSIIGVARPRDGSFFDEDSPTNPDQVSLSARDGEEIARTIGEKNKFNVAVLRCGWFYGADSAHTQLFADSLRKRQLPIIGSGDAVWACLHLDDAAQAYITAAASDRNGIWHVVDNQPVSVREFLYYFAKCLGTPLPLSIPVWVGRLAAGSYSTDFFTVSSRTSSGLFHRDFGWTPQFPSFKEGIDQIVMTWSPEKKDTLR